MEAPYSDKPTCAPGPRTRRTVRVYPTLMGQYAQCPSIAGFAAFGGPARSAPPFMQAGLERGRAIHAAVDHQLKGEEVPPHLQGPLKADAVDTPATASALITDFMRAAWPGYTWLSEQKLTREIGEIVVECRARQGQPEWCPACSGRGLVAGWSCQDCAGKGHAWPVEALGEVFNLRHETDPDGVRWAVWSEIRTVVLVGKVDYLGRPPADWSAHGYAGPQPGVVVDLKCRTNIAARLAIVSQSPTWDSQTLVYEYLATGHPHFADLPGDRQLWQVLYQPARAQTRRREYPTSPGAVQRALDLALRVAADITVMGETHPSRWLRSMQCADPYPCPCVSDCTRSLGAYYPRDQREPAHPADVAPTPAAHEDLAGLMAAFAPPPKR